MFTKLAAFVMVWCWLKPLPDAINDVGRLGQNVARAIVVYIFVGNDRKIIIGFAVKYFGSKPAFHDAAVGRDGLWLVDFRLAAGCPYEISEESLAELDLGLWIDKS